MPAAFVPQYKRSPCQRTNVVQLNLAKSTEQDGWLVWFFLVGFEEWKRNTQKKKRNTIEYENAASAQVNWRCSAEITPPYYQRGWWWNCCSTLWGTNDSMLAQDRLTIVAFERWPLDFAISPQARPVRSC